MLGDIGAIISSFGYKYPVLREVWENPFGELKRKMRSHATKFFAGCALPFYLHKSIDLYINKYALAT